MEKCPFCGLLGIPRNMIKEHIDYIYLPPRALGINKIITKTKFCIFCEKEFIVE